MRPPATDAPSTRARLEPEQRQAQIVAAARRLFAEHPYAGVSMSDVARAAGVTRALVHHYFQTKRELYGAVVRSLMDEGPEIVRTDLDLPPQQMVAANVDAALAFVAANRQTLFEIMQPGGLEHDPELSAVVEEARERLVDRMILNHTGTLAHPPEVRLLIRAYLGLFQAATREWLDRGRASREATRLLLVHTLLAMVRDALPVLLAGARQTSD
jgi:AcrR family transcriptional regulator